MSNKEKVVELLDSVPDYKMGYVLAYVQGITADEEADDIYSEGIAVPKYKRIILGSEEDKKWIAEMPELPGCMADGSTPNEALENAKAVIQEWIETAQSLGRAVPEPTFNRIGIL